MEKEDYKKLKETRVTYAIVCKGPLGEFIKLKAYLEEHCTGSYLVYQRVGMHKLYIEEERHREDSG